MPKLLKLTTARSFTQMRLAPLFCKAISSESFVPWATNASVAGGPGQRQQFNSHKRGRSIGRGDHAGVRRRAGRDRGRAGSRIRDGQRVGGRRQAAVDRQGRRGRPYPRR